MARGRMINKNIVKSRKFNALTDDSARLLYALMLAFADRDGRLEGDTDLIKAMVFPRRDDVTLKMIAKWLNILSATGLIDWYEVDGDQFIQITKFAEGQEGMRYDREPRSTIPEPCGSLPAVCGTFPVEVEENRIEVEDKENKKKKHKNGEYQNVLLTDEEMGKLIESLNADLTLEMIRELDEGIEQYGYKYKSHYLTILKWHKKNSTQTPHSTGPTYAKLAVCRNKCTVCGKQADLRYGKCEECTGEA